MSCQVRLLALIALVVLVLVAVSVGSDPDRGPTAAEEWLLEGVGSVQKVFTTGAWRLETLWRDYFHLYDLQQENKRLRDRLARANARVKALREAELANRRLRGLLNFTNHHDLEFIGARVVAWNPRPWFKTINVDRGARDGVEIGMAVVSDQGVVGRVVNVSPSFARVLLIIDYNSSVDAFIQRSRVRGILAGRSEEECSFKYALKNDDVAVDDLVVTSGMGGVFPKGLPLGTVIDINRSGQDIFTEIEVQPAVNFNHLEEVLIILAEQADF